MSSSVNETANSRWPSQVRYIIGNEACERFSYYGMRSILAGYITGTVLQGGLGQTADRSTEIIHTFVSVNYFTPLLGAWLSDKLFGRYRTILWVSLLYCAGHGVLACSDFVGGVNGKMWCLFAGLTLIAFGAGGIKPCVSAFMGDQFKPEQSHLLQKAYGAFYWSINLGSFFSFLVVPWVKNHHGYSWAFGVPGILMAIATVIFWMGTKHYEHVPPSRVTKSAGFFKVLFYAFRSAVIRPSDQKKPRAAASNSLLGFALLVLAPALYVILGLLLGGARGLPDAIGNPAPISLAAALGCIVASIAAFTGKFQLRICWDTALTRFSPQEVDAAKSVLPILGVFALVPPFWSLFDQTNSTWVLQGKQMISYSLFGFTIGPEEMQSANPLLVMILVPLLTLLVYPRLGKWASPLRRMSYGMVLAAFSYVIVAGLQQRLEAGQQLSIAWQLLPYVVLTAAEVLVSTTGLEFAFREAAPEMKSLITSFWWLTVTAGNMLVAFITKFFSESSGNTSVTSGRFMMYAGLSFVVAILFGCATTFYRYRDKTAALGR